MPPCQELRSNHRNGFRNRKRELRNNRPPYPAAMIAKSRSLAYIRAAVRCGAPHVARQRVLAPESPASASKASAANPRRPAW